MYIKTVILLIYAFGVHRPAAAQEVTPTADSANVIRKIEQIAQKRKSSRFLYSLIFKPVTTKETNPSRRRYGYINQPPFNPFEGKIIRNISITTLDPFGYDIEDTLTQPDTRIFKTGNSLHLKTLAVTIRNQLLFKKNTPFDSLLVIESEHLIRGQKYVHEVLISPFLAVEDADSVDINVRVIDVWSIEPAISVTAPGGEGILNDNNFLGTGHSFLNDITWKNATGKTGYTGSYIVPGILNTYVSTTIYYSIDQDNNDKQSITVERPFYSTITRWAGGIHAGRQHQRPFQANSVSAYAHSGFEVWQQDYWAGISWLPFRNSSVKNHNMNLVISARNMRTRYQPAPDYAGNPAVIYANEDFYLSSIGISSRYYNRERYLFKYGTTEDVPVGKSITMIGGYQIMNRIGRTYAGTKVSWGNFTKWGYVSAQLEYGTFIRNATAEQGVLKGGINYFTDLFLVGRWKFRQFIKQQYTLGMNRKAQEKLTINNGNGLRGFNSAPLSGNERTILSLQSQSYSPWNVLGFNFGPYLHASFAMLGNKNMLFKGSTVYSQFGIGILIKNEFLILGTFQISCAYYPVVPGTGSNIFLINPFRTSDFGLSDFVTGKPDPPLFQ